MSVVCRLATAQPHHMCTAGDNRKDDGLAFVSTKFPFQQITGLLCLLLQVYSSSTGKSNYNILTEYIFFI